MASFFTLSGGGFVEPPRNGFVERCQAAAAAGFAGIGFHIDDLARTAAAGVDVGEMRAVLRDTDLRMVEIEFLAGWAFGVDEAGLEESVGAIEDVADAFGGRHVSAGEFRSTDTGFAIEAAAARLLVAIEAFPWSAVSSLDIAMELVRHAAATNVGLLIDVWHFYNTGATPAQLDDLPGAGIAAFQLNDGHRVHDDVLTHARQGRMLPGEGELDVVGLIRAARRAGFTGPYSVEVNTPEFRALPVAEAAAQAYGAAAAVLAASEQPGT